MFIITHKYQPFKAQWSLNVPPAQPYH